MGLGDRSSACDAASAAAARLKREDFRRTKHDSAFCQWKILIGASDWEDHLMGKEGVERYRTQNLPNWTSCPGVYELGIATSRPRSGRGTRKLDPTSVIPVYLGQADNLRNRLQQYGRDGAHLENGSTSSKTVDSQRGLGLFTDIFSRGLPIVYRCAPIKSKKDAEITEKELLDKFDYAWNKGSNGSRRQNDIHKKLERLEKVSKFALLAKKFIFSNQKEVGIKIRRDSNLSEKNNKTIFWRILGLRRLQARPMQYDNSDCGNSICGVAIGHGSVCNSSPVAGRKRCAMHKGLRINGYISKLDTLGKVPPTAANEESAVVIDEHFSDLQDPKQSYITEHCHPSEKANGRKIMLTCGVVLEDGSSCKRSPVRGNRRCLEHKGRRIRRSKQSLQGKNNE